MPCFSKQIHIGHLYDDYGELAVTFPAWPPAVYKNLPRSERKYWVQFGRAAYERREKKTTDMISKLVETAGNMLVRRRR